jgi:phthiocerol/phenolphthiocerol synthesis type-I polyketide synthase D
LLADEPTFASAIAELEPTFVARVGFSLREVLTGGEPVLGIERIQPVLVGVQLALTELWRSYGVEPDAVIGHSMGEVSAAVVSGALTADEGLQVIATRSRLMSRLSGQGAMALLELDAADTQALIDSHPRVTLAVYASPNQTVIAGPPEDVNELIAAVQQRNRLARLIDVDVASHHPIIDPLLPELRAALAGLAPKTPGISLITTTYDHTGGTAPVFDAQYWAANLRNPVRFSQAVAAAGAEHGTFIEVSPHPLLIHAITETLASVRPRGDAHVAVTLNRDEHEALTFHTQLAAVRPHSGGTAQSAGSGGRLADVPPAPWQHSTYWVSNRSAGRVLADVHPLLGAHMEVPSGDHVWQADVGTEMIPWLADHRVHGQPIMPAAAFAEIALAAGCVALGMAVEAVEVSRLEIEQMLTLDGQTQLTTQLIRSADNGIRVEIQSRSTDGSWRRHAVARVDLAQRDGPAERTGSPAEGGTAVSPADLYAALRRTGTHHGQAFAALTRIVRMPSGRSETEIALPEEAAPHRDYRLHPVMLDAALQSLAAAMPAESLSDAAEATYLPVSFETIRVLGDVGRRARCRAEMVSLDGDGAGKLGSIILTDEAGTPTAEITGVYLRRVERRTVPLPLEQKIFDTVWVRTPTSSGSGPTVSDPPAGSWLLLTDGAEATAIAADFSTSFGSPTRRVISADLSNESAVLEAFARTAAEPELPPVGVVVLIGRRSFDGTDADGALARAQNLILGISAAVRAIVGGWHGKPPRLWLVTRSGLVVHDDELGDPAIGALKGLIRVLAYEHPALRATLVDLDMAHDIDVPLTTELGFLGTDDIIAWRGESRTVERLSRATVAAPQRDPVVRPECSYIVTGGLGGLGMVVARWLVDGGAGRVVLNSRSDPGNGQPTSLADLDSRAEIAVVRGDVAATGVAERLVTAAEETGLPLRGVIHAAAVIDDGLLANLSREGLERVWTPKVAGALRLHEVTASRQLDWWVGFSSMASLLGSPGQGAYACANAWLDALVAWRRASGLPATAINWGQWSDVGVARSLTLSVLDPIAPAEGIEALESLVGGNLTRAGVARLRLDRAAAAFPEISGLGYFARLVEELDALSDGDDWPGPDALRELDALEANRVITQRLRGRILAIMGYPDGWAIDTGQPLIDLGMDSLMAVRIRNTTRGDFGVEPPVALLLQGASLQDLTADLIDQLGLAGQDPTEPANGLRDRTHQRAAARQRAAKRRTAGQRA